MFILVLVLRRRHRGPTDAAEFRRLLQLDGDEHGLQRPPHSGVAALRPEPRRIRHERGRWSARAGNTLTRRQERFDAPSTSLFTYERCLRVQERECTASSRATEPVVMPIISHPLIQRYGGRKAQYAILPCKVPTLFFRVDKDGVVVYSKKLSAFIFHACFKCRQINYASCRAMG